MEGLLDIGAHQTYIGQVGLKKTCTRVASDQNTKLLKKIRKDKFLFNENL